MNIVQIHRKIKSRLDQVNTPRFKTWQIDNVINTAINNLLTYKMAGVVENGKRVSFQKTRKIRDELYTIVKSRNLIGTLVLTTASGDFAIDDVISGDVSAAIAIITKVTGTTTKTIEFKYTSAVGINFVAGDTITNASTGTGTFSSVTYPIRLDTVNDQVLYLPGTNSLDTSVYRYLLTLKIKINDQTEDYCIPITYDDVPLLDKNPYMRPDKDYPQKFYYIESASGLSCFYGKVDDDYLSDAEIFFIAQPLIVKFGTEITNASAVVTVNTPAIAITETVYNNGAPDINVTYQPGEEFTILVASGIKKITSGSATVNFINTDMPIALHEEIIQEGATILNLDIENYNKWKAMEESDQLNKK